MIFILQAGLYELLPKKPMYELENDIYFYEKYVFCVAREATYINKAISLSSKIKDNYLKDLALRIVSSQINNPYLDFVIDYPSFTIEELIKYINDVRFGLKVYMDADVENCETEEARFEKFKKDNNLKPYIQLSALNTIFLCGICFDSSQNIKIFEQLGNMNYEYIDTFKKEAEFISSNKNIFIWEINNLEYNLYEALADAMFYNDTKKDRRLLKRKNKIFF
ncbi:MAG: hypothetical protein IJK61_04940 [Bacteroidetes bacterium]|nr:hypothetical protein [Bacteroidota bacterium]